MYLVVFHLKNAGVVLMTENFVSEGREGKRSIKETVHDTKAKRVGKGRILRLFHIHGLAPRSL